MGASVEVKN